MPTLFVGEIHISRLGSEETISESHSEAQNLRVWKGLLKITEWPSVISNQPRGLLRWCKCISGQGRDSDVIDLGISQAFDVAPPNILLSRLEGYGFDK